MVKFKRVEYLDYTYPVWAEIIGILMAVSSIVVMPGYALYKFIVTPGTIRHVSILPFYMPFS